MRNLMIATLMLAGGLYLFACSNANTGATPPQTIDRMVDTAGNTNVYEAAIDGMT